MTLKESTPKDRATLLPTFVIDGVIISSSIYFYIVQHISSTTQCVVFRVRGVLLSDLDSILYALNLCCVPTILGC